MGNADDLCEAIRPVFVFGSNIEGRHGKGAAKEALRKWGAIYGMGQGHHGSSYAIPTKDRQMRPCSLDTIGHHVREFLAYARSRPELTFLVTRIGCGLAGYTEEQIRPLFDGAPENCVFSWVGMPAPEDES